MTVHGRKKRYMALVPGTGKMLILVSNCNRLSMVRSLFGIRFCILVRRCLSPGVALDAATAREVAVRDGIKAVVVGQVSPAGSGYVLSVRLLAAESGEVLAARRETARSADDLIAAIDELSEGLREEIGESLKSTRGNPPLDEVTTSSLTALQKYSEAVRLTEVEGSVELAVTLLEEAIAIFKLNAETFPDSWEAHRSLAEAYLAIGNRELAIQSYQKALEINPDDADIKKAVEELGE